MTIRHVTLVIVFSAILLFVPTTSTIAQDASPEFRVVGYYTASSLYDQEFFVTDIPAHVNYTPISVSKNGQCVSSDVWTDTQYSYPNDKPYERLRGNFKQLQLLKKKSPELKVLMSVGGWEQSRYFSDAALTQESRTRFARSCVAFMHTYGFDGIDVDWRYPVSGGAPENNARPEDRENYTLLLAALREQLDLRSKQDDQSYLLTVTAPAVDSLYANIQLDQIHIYLDWINLTAYGFHGSWSTLASHQAPLYANTRDPRGEYVQNVYNVDAAVTAYLDAGVPANKIDVGIPFYAQTWSNVPANDFFGLYQPAGGVPAGARPGGILYYRDLMPLLNSTSYVRFFDDETKSPWLYNAAERIAISYEDQESILYKTAYVRSLGLGGIMVWELSYDDNAHTLLNAAHDGLTLSVR